MTMSTVRLDAVAGIVMGQAPAGDSYNSVGRGWPLVAGAGDFSGDGLMPKKYTSNPTKLSAPGDIFISIRASIGARVLSNSEYCIGRGVASIRANPAVLDQRYLWQWLDVARHPLSAKGRGATFLQVSRSDIAELEIRLPSLPEQRRIAAILDQADELCAKRRRAIHLFEEFTDSLFIEMFGDPMHSSQDPSAQRLGDIVNAVVDCPHTTPTWVDSGVVCLRTPNLTKGDWDFSETRFVSEATHMARTKRASLEAGDIVLSREGKVGVGAIIGDQLRASMGQRLVQIRPNMGVATSEFLLAYLMEVLQPKRLSRLLVGSTAKHINVSDLKALPVLVPPIDRQAEFAARMVLMREELCRYTAELRILNELFSSLQHRAFRGEL